MFGMFSWKIGPAKLKKCYCCSCSQIFIPLDRSILKTQAVESSAIIWNPLVPLESLLILFNTLESFSILWNPLESLWNYFGIIWDPIESFEFF